MKNRPLSGSWLASERLPELNEVEEDSAIEEDLVSREDRERDCIAEIDDMKKTDHE